MLETQSPAAPLDIADKAEMGSARTCMDYIAVAACHCCSSAAVVVELAGSRTGCSSPDYTSRAVAAAGKAADCCIGDAWYHGAHPALPADDDRSSCRRGY